ncbi:MAG: bifunctional folylpolyglutamate synthase/dihydrofolate synthase [Verrucomicrobia bacterium]|nr:MAG: bifunctional folylpolyglutamate synthase/dihydrofolate synthase [Verrucomicrobiota bacterium]
MTYAEAVQFLYELRWLGIKLGLDKVRRLAAACGDPHHRLRFIHVAGTNGKGSVCAMLAAIHRAAGRRVGLFTSPHLLSFRERIQVDGRWIAEAEVAERVAALRPVLRALPPDQAATFFEVTTLLALQHFAAAGCDLVIWETGMGGRLDATNIVTPLAAVITNVQRDHCQWLGDTLAQIAAEKAGIIKPGIPVLTAAQEPEALAVLRAVARHQEAPLIEVPPEAAGQPPLDRLRLSLPGRHQRLNAALALRVVETLQDVLPVPPEAVARGLESVELPGRFQLIRDGERTTVLDGAHNPGAARVLREAWEEAFPSRRAVMILGGLQEKDWPGLGAELLPCASEVFAVPVASPQRIDPRELVSICHRIDPHLTVHACQSVDEALQATAAAPLRLVTGSLYLVGEVLARLRPDAGPDERWLNEKAFPSNPTEASPPRR